jgi:hypothetical protein
MLDSTDCFFHGQNCDASSLDTTEPNFTLFVGGLIALGLGVLMFISAKQEKK